MSAYRQKPFIARADQDSLRVDAGPLFPSINLFVAIMAIIHSAASVGMLASFTASDRVHKPSTLGELLIATICGAAPVLTWVWMERLARGLVFPGANVVGDTEPWSSKRTFCPAPYTDRQSITNRRHPLDAVSSR